MDRQQAFQRVQTWLAVYGLLNVRPNYEQANKLSNLIFNITDRKEVYSTGFIFDIWNDLSVKENESK